MNKLKKGTVFISLTVDWEGQSLETIRHINWLREKIGFQIPLTHYICPAYFLTDDSSIKIVRQQILPEDEVALHIHPLRELVSFCDVPFRSEHNFYRANDGYIPSWIRKLLPGKLAHLLTYPVSGRGVPLSVYSFDEIIRIIRRSKLLLEKALNLPKVSGFRSGGNMASDNVLKALSDLGFQYDSSATPPCILSKGYFFGREGNNLDDYGDDNGLYTAYVKKLWGQKIQTEYFLKNNIIKKAHNKEIITPHSQPFKVFDLVEMPNNGGMSDFASANGTTIPLFNWAVKQATNFNRDVYINLGFHQEGSIDMKLAILQFMKYMKSNHFDNVSFLTVEQACNNYQYTQQMVPERKQESNASRPVFLRKKTVVNK